MHSAAGTSPSSERTHDAPAQDPAVGDSSLALRRPMFGDAVLIEAIALASIAQIAGLALTMTEGFR